MEAPSIQFATSVDGTDIAFAEIGSGPPLVLVDSFLSGGLDVRSRSRRATAFFGALSANRSVIAFDWRNSGLSGPAEEFNIETLVGDLEAVIKRAGLERFDLWALQSSGHIAVEFAVRNPSLIRRIVFSQPRPRGAFNRIYAFGKTLAEAAESDWDAFTELYALRNYRWTETAAEFMGELRKQWTPGKLREFMAVVDSLDLFNRAALVEAEAMVLVKSDDIESNLQAGRRLAAMLPRGQLAIARLEHARDPEQVRIGGQFLGDFDSGHAELTPFRVILFTDIENHTPIMQRLGDSRGRDLLREHERITRQALRANSGTEIKSLGDGFMASFGSAQQALECAIELQRALRELDVDGEPVRVRVGVNAGEPIAEGDDLFGSSVILAQRTAARARGGQILVTDVVRQLAAGKGFIFLDEGEITLRGFEQPVRLYDLRWQNEVAPA